MSSDDFVWSAEGGVVTLNGHIVLTMPLRENAVPGRTHTASCTLCRYQQTLTGRRGNPDAGTLGFFRSEAHKNTFVKQHVEAHRKKGEEVHIVNLPARKPAVQPEESVSG